MSRRSRARYRRLRAKKRAFATKEEASDIYPVQNPPIDQIQHLQNSAGNQAVQGLFDVGKIQPKLKIGQPGDKYELEADRMADQVMRMPELKESRVTSPESLVKRKTKNIQTKPISTQITSLVQRQAEDEEGKKKEEELIQTKERNSATREIFPDVESDVNSLKEGGETLSESTRAYFEPRFGYDFSGVRVHTDSQANRSAQSINSKAFTIGSDIVFNKSKYSPETKSGKNLLAHELTHVIQQNQDDTGIRRSPLTEEEKKENLESEKYAPNFRLQKAFDNDPLLRYGERGEAVKLIQEGLVEDGFFMPESTKPSGEMDGIFGPETLLTIKQFQIKYDLLVDGIVGRETMGKLDELAQMQPVIPQDIPKTIPPDIPPPLGKGWYGGKIPGLGQDLPGYNPKAKQGQNEKPAESPRCTIPSGTPTYIPGTNNTWVRVAHIAVCAKENCTLGVLSQALTKKGNNWPCIGICYMGSPKAASSGKDYYKYIWPGDMFDVSNLIQSEGTTSTLKIHLFDTGTEPKYAQWVLYFYPDARVEGSFLPEDDIARASGEGLTPIKDFLIFGHSSGEKMMGGSCPGGFTPNKRSDIPEATYDRAIQSKFPQRCWFTADARCRAVGCDSDAFGKAFAGTYLRSGSSVWVTTASVKPVCPSVLAIPYIEDCVLYTGIVFSTSFMPHQGRILAGPYWNTENFHNSSYWKLIQGVL